MADDKNCHRTVVRCEDLSGVSKRFELRVIASGFILILLIVCTLSYLCVLPIEDRRETSKIELNLALKIYSSSLLSRIGIIVSATEFIEFIRSGELTRRKLRKNFTSLMARMLKKSDIEGWVIWKGDEEIFNFGVKSKHLINIPLCYVGDVLMSETGDCVGNLTVFLSEVGIFEELNKINPAINICVNCESIKKLPIVDRSVYGNFSSINLKISLEKKDDTTKIFMAGIIILIFITVVVMNFLRQWIKNIFKETIVDPVEKGISKIKEIDDLNYRKNLLMVKAIAEEDLLRSLANDIHDIFGVHLYKLRLSLDKLIKKFSKNINADQRDIIDKIKEDVKILSEIVYHFIDSLRPEVVDTLGLIGALQAKVLEWNKMSTAEYSLSCSVSEDEILEHLKLPVYRVCHEALTNVFKHSQAKTVTLSLGKSDDCKFLNLVIIDDGKGFIFDDRLVGHGITSMKERAITMGGDLQIESALGEGTKVIIRFNLYEVQDGRAYTSLRSRRPPDNYHGVARAG